MAKRAVVGGAIAGGIIAVILLAGVYSYQQVRVVDQNVEITDIKFSITGTLKGLFNFLLSGNFLALLSAIDRVDLLITADIQNGGFLPLTIPRVPYKVYVNDEWVGDGQVAESLFIEGGHTKKLLIHHSIPGKSLQPTFNTIIDRDGILTVKVDFTPQFRWGGFETPKLFVIQKDIDLIDEIRKKI